MVDLWKLLKGYHYHRDFEDVPQERRDAVFNALLGYCELDTLAMVMLVEAWRGNFKKSYIVNLTVFYKKYPRPVSGLHKRSFELVIIISIFLLIFLQLFQNRFQTNCPDVL